MTQKRINPDTGRIEERQTVLGGMGGAYWVPTENEEGNQERIDPKTGRYEERATFLGGLAGSAWVAKENDQGSAGWSETTPDSEGGTEPKSSRTSTYTTYGSSSSGSGSSQGNPLPWLAIAAVGYLAVVVGAFLLIQKVATWSFVWWLCVLAIAAGIPLYIAVAYAAFWVMVGCFVLLILVTLLDHFIKNPF